MDVAKLQAVVEHIIGVAKAAGGVALGAGGMLLGNQAYQGIKNTSEIVKAILPGILGYAGLRMGSSGIVAKSSGTILDELNRFKAALTGGLLPKVAPSWTKGLSPSMLEAYQGVAASSKLSGVPSIAALQTGSTGLAETAETVAIVGAFAKIAPMLKTLGEFAGKIAIPLAAIIGFGTSVIKNWDDLSSAFGRFKDSMGEIKSHADSMVKEIGDALGIDLGAFLDRIMRILSFSAIFDAITGNIVVAIDTIKTFFLDIPNAINDTFDKFKAALKAGTSFNGFKDLASSLWQILLDWKDQVIVDFRNAFLGGKVPTPEISATIKEDLNKTLAGPFSTGVTPNPFSSNFYEMLGIKPPEDNSWKTQLYGYGGEGELVWPLPGKYQTITSGYNAERDGKLHGKIDIGAPRGTDVYAAKAGTVIANWPAGDKNGGGRMLFVEDANGKVAMYTHITGNLPTGDIKVGDKIGKVYRDHLDFGVMDKGVWDAFKAQGFAKSKSPWRLGVTDDPIAYLKGSESVQASAKYSEALSKYSKDASDKLKQESEKRTADSKAHEERLLEMQTKYVATLLEQSPQLAFGLGSKGIVDPVKILQSLGLNPQDTATMTARLKESEESAKKTSMMQPLLDAMGKSVDAARAKFDELTSTVDGLRGSMSGLQDALGNFKASRADAFGLKGEAQAIRADSTVRQYQQAVDALDNWRGQTSMGPDGRYYTNAQLLQQKYAPVQTQYNTMVGQALQTGAQGYDLAGNLIGQEGYAPLGKDLRGQIEAISTKSGLQGVAQTALLDSGSMLQTAASDLSRAAADLSTAAGQLANAKAPVPVPAQSTTPGASNLGGYNILAPRTGAYNFNTSGNAFKPNIGYGFGSRSIADRVQAYVPTPAPATFNNLGGGGGYWDDNPAGSDDFQTYGCETGSCKYRYHHPGKESGTPYTGLLADKYAGNKGPQQPGGG
jgi:hypothetical protein